MVLLLWLSLLIAIGVSFGAVVQILLVSVKVSEWPPYGNQLFTLFKRVGNKPKCKRELTINQMDTQLPKPN